MSDDALEWLKTHAARTPDHVCLLTESESLSYRSFLNASSDVAASLAASGVKAGNHVAIGHESFPNCFTAIFGTWLLGAVAIPLNPGLPEEALLTILNKARASAVLGTDSFSRLAKPTLKSLRGKTNRHSDLVLFTSGSTGIPKGVLLSLSGFSANATVAAAAVGLTANDRLFVATPPYFTSALCHFASVIKAGATMIGRRQFFFGQALLEALGETNATGFGGAPTHLIRLVDTTIASDFPKSLRFWISSGDHLSKEVILQSRLLFPELQIITFYGLTEVSGRLCVLPFEQLPMLAGSVGKPLHGMRLTVRRETGEIAAPGEIGELFAQGPMVMQGYLDDENSTRSALTEQGFRTGDYGRCDAAGWFWIEGRRDDIFKVGAEKVSAVLIQKTLLGTGWFSEVAVRGAEDALLGKVPEAFVVFRAEAKPPGASEIRSALKKLLPATHLPARFFSLSQLPRTGSGKIAWKSLAEKRDMLTLLPV